MATKHVQVFKAERKEYTGQNNRKSVYFICQAFILEDSEVGEMRVNEALAKQWLDDKGELPIGVYAVDCSLGVGWQDKKMGGQVSSLERVTRSNNPAGVVAPPASASAEKPKA